MYSWTENTEGSCGLLPQTENASQRSCLDPYTQLCSWPDSGTDPTDPTLLFSLAGAAGDQGLPGLCPGSDWAAGGGIHHVHTPGSTSDFYKEETEEGTSFNCCMKADSWIWEDPHQ